MIHYVRSVERNRNNLNVYEKRQYPICGFELIIKSEEEVTQFTEKVTCQNCIDEISTWYQPVCCQTCHKKLDNIDLQQLSCEDYKRECINCKKIKTN